MKTLLSICFIILLTGCATLPSKDIPQLVYANEDDGIVIGAIAIKNEKPIFNSYFYYYTGDGIKSAKMIRINPEQMVKMKFKPDFFDGDKAVYYFSIKEKPGNYKFVNFRLFENGAFMTATMNLPFSLDFNIEKGKVKYIGEIYFSYKDEILTTNDEKERDLPRLKEKFPNLPIE